LEFLLEIWTTYRRDAEGAEFYIDFIGNRTRMNADGRG